MSRKGLYEVYSPYNDVRIIIAALIGLVLGAGVTAFFYENR